MEDRRKNRSDERKIDGAEAWEAVLSFLKRHMVILGIGVPLIAGVFNAGGRLKGIEDGQVSLSKQNSDTQTTLLAHGAKLDNDHDMLVVLCVKIGCDIHSAQPRPQTLDSGTAKDAPPPPASKLVPPPGVQAQKDKPAPISDISRSTW